MSGKSKKYEENYAILEKITESLNKDEIGIDDLVEKTKEALEAAKNCIHILQKQQGEFKKLEADFTRLLNDDHDDEGQNEDQNKGGDDPF